AEDGIRDPLVTGVQTCALPIYALLDILVLGFDDRHNGSLHGQLLGRETQQEVTDAAQPCSGSTVNSIPEKRLIRRWNRRRASSRSEERRVGKGRRGERGARPDG